MTSFFPDLNVWLRSPLPATLAQREVFEFTDRHGILVAPHGSSDGLFGLAAQGRRE